MNRYPRKIKGMPADVYNRTLWTIRGYTRMKEAAEDIIHERKQQGEKVQTNTPGNPTARIAEEREALLKDIKAVEDALNTIPAEYRKMVMENIADKKAAYNIQGAHENTIYNYRKKMFIETAKNLKLLNDKQYRSLKK